MKNYKTVLNKGQRKASKKITKKLEQYGIALLWGEIRSGKTRSFLNASRGYKTLVVTKKDSIGGILSEAKEIGIEVDVINYQSIHKMQPEDYTLIILDESHLYISQATPKFSPTWKNVVKFTKGKFIIYASGTPTPEGYGGLYSMLALSKWTPFQHKRFTLWFEEYGIPSTTYTGTRQVPSYKKTKEKKIVKAIKHLVVKLTRKETGHIHEAEEVLHNIPMTKEQDKLSNKLKNDLVIPKLNILADTPVKLLTKLHQISGGVGVNGEDDLYYLKKVPPKVEYLLNNFDQETTIILSHYIHEQKYLETVFKHTGSTTKMSTGVDLSHFKTMVIYSMAFSAATHEQVKGRLMNVNRKTPIKVHYLLSGIDTYVYDAVSSKSNFTSRWYKKNGK